jgi:hypothetical protein
MIMRFLVASWILSAAFAALAQGPERLVYYSDYFSFIGEDAQGKVAFALDTNRGQDGEEFLAEHFVVLHDERKGWVRLSGNGKYPNPAGVLAAIPDSKDFAFQGSAEKGMTVKSSTNRIELEAAPIPKVLERRQESATYWLGSAAATLRWDARTVPGRVIYEYLHRPGYNRLSRTYFGQWRDFHGLYLRIEGGGDFYLHRRDPGDEEPLTGSLLGFMVFDSRSGVVRELSIDVAGRSHALGFYRWPQAWRGSFQLGGETYRFELTLTERDVVRNWVIGGFSMGIARGELRRGGEVRKLYGLAELIL